MNKAQERDTTIWEICRVCALQMVGGPRCYHHNPTVEERERRQSITTGACCCCCGEAWAGYAARHPLDPNAVGPFRYTGSGRFWCAFCFDVCKAAVTHAGRAAPKGGKATI